MSSVIKRSFTLILLVSMTVFSSLNCFAANYWDSDYLVSANSSENEKSYGLIFEQIAENSKYRLFADRNSGKFYVEDLASGAKWYSNPYTIKNTDASGVYKMELDSLLLINVYDKKSNMLEKMNSAALSVKKGLVEFKTCLSGFEVTYEFDGTDIRIPLKITLSDSGIIASIDHEAIKEPNTLFNISVLPYFNAGSTDDSGYALLPDGSGSLMYFNNHRSDAAEYLVPIYGRDASSSSVTMPQNVYNANMPIFGIKNGDHSFFAIISKGAAQTTLHALTNGMNTSYATTYPQFSLRGTDTVVLGENTGLPQSYQMYQTDGIAIDGIEISYSLLSGEDKDYNDMAQLYRKYLIDTYNLSNRKIKNSGLYFEFYGAVKKKKNFLGLRITRNQRLSTLSGISDIIDILSENKISGVNVVLKNWTKAQLSSKVDKKLDILSVVGNNKQLKVLSDKISKQNGSFFPEVQFQSFSKSGNDVSVYSDTVRNVSNMPATVYDYKINTLVKNKRNLRKYFLNFKVQSQVAKKISDFADKKEIGSLSLSSAELYSDYGENTVSRSSALESTKKLLTSLSSKRALHISSPAEFALSGVTSATNVPMKSNRYAITDCSVPFYQLAVSGLIDYAGESINLSSDSYLSLLNCLETGSGLLYTLITEDNDTVIDTELNGLYSSNFENLKNELIEYYGIVSSVSDVSDNSCIIRHTRLSDEVMKTEYENGAMVYVNYGTADYISGDLTVPQRGYIILDKKGVKK